MEHWKTVIWKGVRTEYLVSNYGRVRKRKSVVFDVGGERRQGSKKIVAMKDCNNGNGYRFIKLMVKKGVRVKFYIHRLVFEAFVRPLEKGEQVDHLDGNRGNNVLSNIEVVSPKENCIRRSKRMRERKELEKASEYKF